LEEEEEARPRARFLDERVSASEEERERKVPLAVVW
jgi:hypothetical protein